MKRIIAFRADANEAIGLGHIIRSLSLALMIKDKYHVLFYVQKTRQAIHNTIRSNAFDLNLLQNEEDFFNRLSGDEIVVLDGYQFDTAHQKRVKAKGCRLVCIDDLHNKYFVADIIINHAPGVTERMYSAEPHTRFLLGLDYVLLRPNFIQQAKAQRVINRKNHIVICFGGSDPKNLTHSTLEVVLEFPSLKKIIVIVGSGYKEKPRLVELKKSHSSRVELFHDVGEAQIIACFDDAQLAIVPASGILFEAIACKVPVISGYYTANQIDIYKGFLELGVMHDAGEFEQVKLRQALKEAVSSDNERLVHNQKKCIDGKSPSRFLESFQDL